LNAALARLQDQVKPFRGFQPTSGSFLKFGKHLDLAEQLASTSGLPSPLLNAALPVYRTAEASDRCSDDTAAVIDFLR
jgi:3-hydroxyisobutyrate dehydrogenase-like beta-hydroxyacid dehydrogenase